MIRISPLRSAAALVGGLALTLAACGGNDTDDAASASTAPAATTATTDPPATPVPATAPTETAAPDTTAGSTSSPTTATGDDAITIAGFAFSGVTEVAVGTTVTVTNTDGSPHTWTAVDGAFDSGSIAPGDSFEFTFSEPGTFEYFCNFHPSMEGTITVTG